MIASLRLAARLCWIVPACGLLSACRENPVSFYTAPASHDHAGHDHAGHGTASGPAATPEASRLAWTRPAAWTEKPASAMRIGSFAFTAPDGAVADVSISSFPDSAGGLLANINRWRGQVGLAPVDEAGLGTTATRTEVAGLPAWFVDFAGTPAEGDGAGLVRITGAIVPLGSMSWFFKMMGPDAVVRSQRGALDELLASVRAVAPAAPAAADPHAGVPGAPPLAATAAPTTPGKDPAAVPPPPRQEGFAYDTPAGWVARASTQFRLASFQIPGDGVPAADMAVSAFPGMAGGDLANVNRWRAQVGLAPIDETGLAVGAERIVQGDLAFLVVDLTSPGPMLEGGRKSRILGAILDRGDTGWFFKMTGEAGHVGAQREAFLGFLRSFRFE